MAYVNAARDELFALSVSCEACFGYGVADDWSGGWRVCPYCEGIGRIPSAPLEVLREAHHRWFHAWPHHNRHSLLYGIAESGEVGVPPRYEGPTLAYLRDPSKQVVFGPVPYTCVNGWDAEQTWSFLPEPVARAHAKALQVVYGASTWGELRHALEPDAWMLQHIDEQRSLLDESQAPPTDHAPFAGVDVFPEGQPAPQEAAGDWFPRTGGEPFHGIPLIEIGLQEAYRESDVPAIVAHLERHGYRVVRDDLLVAAAHMPERVTDARQAAPDVGPHPEWPAWLVFHAPHASERIPPAIRSGILIDDDDLRSELERLTDHHIDWLLIPPGRAQAVVVGEVSRLVVDVERFLDDEYEPMARVGMGAIYTRTSDDRPLRATPLPEVRAALLASYYHPHHRRLTTAVQAALDTHDRALILDLHSFPEVPLPCDLDQAPERPDICIGTDAFHTPVDLRDRLVHELMEAGFSVAIDRPYAGVLVPKAFLRRDTRVASVMIEVNRRLYVHPDGLQKPVLQRVGADLRSLVRRAVVHWAVDGDRIGR